MLLVVVGVSKSRVANSSDSSSARDEILDVNFAVLSASRIEKRDD